MLCLKKRRTYSFTQGACTALPRRSKKDNRYEESLNMAITTLPRKNRSREERPSRMVLTVTEDTPADMLAGSMELLVQLPRDHHLHTQRVTVLRSTPMMDLLVQIATAHKLTASSYTLQAIGERGLVLPHHPNTPIGALDALQVKLLPKQGTCAPRKTKQTNQPFETTFRLQVHLPRNQLYVSRVSPKMNLGEILDEVCREKNLDRNKYELRHPANLEETLDLALSLQDYHLQEVTLYAKQARTLGPTLSTQDIMALQRQEERRRQQSKQSVFGFMFKKSKESSVSTDSLGGRSVSPARSDETGRSASPLQPPARPQRKRRPAPKPPTDAAVAAVRDTSDDNGKDKMVINHSRNSSDSSGYHEASVLSDNPDSAARLPETLPRRSKAPGTSDNPRKLAQTSQSSKSLGNLAATGGTLSRGISSTSLSSTGLRKKRAAPPPPAPRPLSSAISTQALERIVDSEESLTSDMDPSKPPSDIGAPSKASSDIDCPKANSDIGVSTQSMRQLDYTSKADVAMCESDDNVQQIRAAKTSTEARSKSDSIDRKLDKADSEVAALVEAVPKVEQARVATKRVGEPAPLPMPRKICAGKNVSVLPKAPKRKVVPPPSVPFRSSSTEHDSANDLSCERASPEDVGEACSPVFSASTVEVSSLDEDTLVTCIEGKQVHSESRNESVKCEPSSKDESNQQEEILTVNDFVTEDDVSIKSSPDHEVESNLHSNELHPDSAESIHVKAEETTFNEKSSSEYKLNQEKIMSDSIDDNMKDHKALTLNRHLSNEESTKSELDSYLIEQDLCDIKFANEENNFAKQNDKMKSENVDLRDDNDSNSYILLNNDSLNENIIKPDRVIEPKTSEQVNLSRHQHACPERPPRISRKMVSTCKNEENTAAAKRVHSEDAMSDGTVKNSIGKDKETCTVISTIPKCEHLDAIKEDRTLSTTTKRGVTLTDHQPLDKRSQVSSTAINADELFEEHKQDGQSDEPNNSAKKWTKVVRSQSKSDDFETDLSKRQRRYLTSSPVDIVYALNLSLSVRDSMPSDTSETKWEQIDAEQNINRTMDVDVDKGDSHGELITAKEDTLSDTDILLQKVSDTLSSALPVSSPASSPEPLHLEYATASVQTNVADILDHPAGKKEPIETKDKPNETYRSCIDLPADTILSTSTPNVTTGSQQDTSDYVSAMGEDLSISDWEYQLPAPPSAFRDSNSPIFNDYDTVTLGSIEAFKEPLMIHPVSGTVDATVKCERKNIESARNLLNDVDANFSRKVSNEKTDVISETEIDINRIANKPIVKQTSSVSQKPETNPDPRKEIISELENKIETGTLAQTINKDFDRRNMDNVSAPRIAPVDNTLSNFTITTYTKQKNLDIFDEFEETVDYSRNSDERFIKTFATLSRNNACVGNHENKSVMTNAGRLTNGMLSHDKKAINKLEETNTDCKIEPKIRNQGEPSHRWQSLSASNEKANVQRSKSYISMSSNAKYQTEAQVTNERKCESRVELEIAGMKKATSITGLNIDMPKSNEKISQWRDNILKRQEEPTKEKELQSLQVLKSILPQLKNAQQAEENVSKEYNSTLSIEKPRYEAESNEHSVKTNVVSTRESRNLEAGLKQPPREENIKRYTYAGPPAISLGSWSERPTVNVQIKMDTDYKLGRNGMSGNKTVVCINGGKEEKISKNNITKHEIKIADSSTNKNSDEIAKRLITHTTASGFKKPLSNRVTASVDPMRDEDKPVVTGVELKKTFVETKETSKNEENEIDTTPVNFRELTKTFGQHVNFKPKPKRANVNRHSTDCHDAQSNEIGRIVDSSIKQNGHAKFARSLDQNNFSFKNQPLMNGDQQNLQTKKFTSIVGINGTSQNFGLQSETPLNAGQRNVNNIMKINPPMPVVKGFKIAATNSRTSNGQTNYNGLSAIDGIRRDAQPPKPPTMPVITGVTLKSASTRPKSMPVQIDPRDMLLASIRNFGGHGKLKSTAERY